MKICFYCDTIFTFGGVQRVLTVIAQSLSTKHQITILTMDPPSSKDTSMYHLNESNIEYQFYRLPPISRIEYTPCKVYSFLYKNVLPQGVVTSKLYAYSSFPSSQKKTLVRVLNEGKYDVVIGVHAFLSLKLAGMRSELNARKVIGWMHNSYEAFFENAPSYLDGLRNHFKHTMKNLDHIVVLSLADKILYKEKLKLDATVIYNPLTVKPEGMSELNSKKFLAVGRFSPRHKGFDILIKGFAEFAKTNQEWTLDIVGEGDEENLFRKLIVDNHLEQRVRMHPFTKNIQAYYKNAQVYVLSSRWEGFGLVTLEAMSHGLPVIASDLPIVRELFAGGNNVLTFRNEDTADLAEKMHQMVSREEWASMQEGSLKIVQGLQIDQIALQWEKLINA